jgi:hypothetical protein
MRRLFASSLIGALSLAAQVSPAFDAASVKLNRDPNPRGVAF